MRKKEKLIDKFWDFLKNLVVIIIFALLLIVSILPEIACWQAVVNGDAPWWTIFLFGSEVNDESWKSRNKNSLQTFLI